MLGFARFLLTHPWMLRIAFVGMLLLTIIFYRHQTHVLTERYDAQSRHLEEVNAAAMANAESLKKLQESMERQAMEIRRINDAALESARQTEEIRKRTRNARKTIGDAPIAPVVRDGLGLLYGAPRGAAQDRVAQPGH